MGGRFFLVFAAEFGSVFLVANLLGRAGLEGFIPPAIALVVGLHFLPLAAIFGVRPYYLTGVLISSVAAVALVALLLGITLGGVYGWAIVVGLATALILWATALRILRDARALLLNGHEPR